MAAAAAAVTTSSLTESAWRSRAAARLTPQLRAGYAQFDTWAYSLKHFRTGVLLLAATIILSVIWSYLPI
jgi:hypothetical protein